MTERAREHAAAEPRAPSVAISDANYPVSDANTISTPELPGGFFGEACENATIELAYQGWEVLDIAREERSWTWYVARRQP